MRIIYEPLAWFSKAKKNWICTCRPIGKYMSSYYILTDSLWDENELGIKWCLWKRFVLSWADMLQVRPTKQFCLNLWNVDVVEFFIYLFVYSFLFLKNKNKNFPLGWEEPTPLPWGPRWIQRDRSMIGLTLGLSHFRRPEPHYRKLQQTGGILLFFSIIWRGTKKKEKEVVAELVFKLLKWRISFLPNRR